MSKRLISGLFAATILLASPAAYAAQMITLSPPAPDGSISGTYQSTSIAAGAFTNIFNFSFPENGIANATVSSIFSVAENNNVDFTSVSLNGVEYEVGTTGNVEFRFIRGLDVVAGLQTIVVNGISGGNGAYAGTIAFAPMAPIPEPAAWAMMLTGMGFIGGALRRRKTAVRVTYA